MSDLKCSIALISVILTILVIGYAPLPYFGGDGRPRSTETKSNISTISTALDAFEVDIGRYPSTAEGLDALFSPPTSLPKDKVWSGPYLSSTRKLQDGWDRKIIYLCPGKHNVEGYDLISAGLDGKLQTDDDITNYPLSE